MGFFKPAWQSDNAKKAVAAVYKIDDESLLVEIIGYEGPLYNEVRTAAVNMLSKQEALLHFAENGDRFNGVRDAAGKKLLSLYPELLAGLARNGNADAACIDAIQRSQDKDTLLDIARHGASFGVRHSAMCRYAVLLNNYKTPINNLDIAKAIPDSFVIADILMNQSMPLFSLKGLLDLITDQEALAAVALHGRHDRYLAIDRITDAALLRALRDKVLAKDRQFVEKRLSELDEGL